MTFSITVRNNVDPTYKMPFDLKSFEQTLRPQDDG